MGRRRLPALFALVAGLLLGAGAGAQGVVASGVPTAHPAVAAHSSGGARPRVDGAVTGHVDPAGTDTFVPVAPRPPSSAIVRSGHAGPSGGSLREAVVLPVLALLAVALAAFVVRQRRRGRPPGWHRSTLLGRGPPLLLTV